MTNLESFETAGVSGDERLVQRMVSGGLDSDRIRWVSSRRMISLVLSRNGLIAIHVLAPADSLFMLKDERATIGD